MAKLTPSEVVKKNRDKRKAQGLIHTLVWIHPDHKTDLREYCAKRLKPKPIDVNSIDDETLKEIYRKVQMMERKKA